MKGTAELAATLLASSVAVLQLIAAVALVHSRWAKDSGCCYDPWLQASGLRKGLYLAGFLLFGTWGFRPEPYG